MCLVLLLCCPLIADTLPKHEIDNINVYNCSVVVPEPGEVYSTLRATVGNSTSYNIKQITFEFTLYNNENVVVTQQLIVYCDIPKGQTKDCSKNFILPCVIEDEKNFRTEIKIISAKGTLKN